MTTETQVNSGIRSSNVQELLESAKNGGAKGQAQFFTTLSLARIAATALPSHRPTLVDLTCGDGHFLIGAANDTTKHLFGADIDGIRTMANEKDLHVNKITGDLTVVHDLLDEVKWKADCFVLNPPWDLHWHKDRLARLKESDLLSVRMAYLSGQDRRLGKDAIDSTVATLMLALDFCTNRGEGVLIANNATLKRLIFSIDAPYSHLRTHCWLKIAVKGNPMTPGGSDDSKWGGDFATGIVWFGRSHVGGEHDLGLVEDESALVAALAGNVRRFRYGVSVGASPHCHEDTRPLWAAVKDEWKSRIDAKKHPQGFNIWLDTDGCIKTQLSLFQSKSFKVDKAAAKRLFALNGQRPMQLVMQRAQRAELLKTVKGDTWSVHPDLTRLVDDAVRQYLSVRAPLTPLTPVMRLGYLDEADEIECIKDLEIVFDCVQAVKSQRPKDAPDIKRFVYKAGKSYALRTQSVKMEKHRVKPNSNGVENEFLIQGHDLAIFIKEENGKERCFMDARMMKPEVKLEGVKVHHPLHLIPEHFEIPEVLDVAALNPDGMTSAVAEINRIESFMAEMGLG